MRWRYAYIAKLNAAAVRDDISFFIVVVVFVILLKQKKAFVGLKDIR